ncbi:MAG: hypothetical protein Q4G28_02125 [Neisseria sp.]|nr:hypothetical protein [Neisseria sp.]
MNTYLIVMNLVAAAVVFVHCVCRLSVRRWTWRQPELWAHALMTGGAVGVLCSSLIRESPHNISEIVINAGLAGYFLAQSWRLHLLKKGKHCG